MSNYSLLLFSHVVEYIVDNVWVGVMKQRYKPLRLGLRSDDDVTNYCATLLMTSLCNCDALTLKVVFTSLGINFI